jgi:outer membrane protein TolC
MAARALARAADARVSSAKLPADPQVQLGLMNYALPGLRPMDPLGMVQFQVMQMVPVFGKLGRAGRVASSQAAAQSERAHDVAWGVRSEVAMTFYDLYQTVQRLAVSRETFRLLQDIRRTAEVMYRVGNGRQADVLRAQVEIARMVEDTLRMTSMRAGIASRLMALLNRADYSPLLPPVLPAFPDSVPSVDSLVAVALTGRPMLQAGEHDLQAANTQAQLARKEIWPDLTIGVQYGRRTGEMGTERMASVMVGAAVPVFAGRRQLRMREEMDAMRQMATSELATMRAETRARIAEAYADLTRARNLATLYRTTVIPEAEASVASSMAAYRVGAVDFMTLLDNRMTVNNYRQELFVLDAEQGRAWADLEMLVGRQLFDANTIVGANRRSWEER